MSGEEQFKKDPMASYITMSEYEDLKNLVKNANTPRENITFAEDFEDYNVREPYFHQNPLLYSCPTPKTFHSHSELELRRQIGYGVACVSILAENLLCHPFLVLRRQCQVHHTSSRYHLQPFTLIPTIIRLHSHQGLTPLWKGLGSALLVRGMSLGIEDLLSKLTPWPKEVNHQSTVKEFCQHIWLKCISIAIVTPFYSASFVETVQSEIASEKPGFLDVFREGFHRLFHWGAPTRVRMLPIWCIVVPTVAYGIVKYLFYLGSKFSAKQIMMFWFRDKLASCEEVPMDSRSSTTALEDELDMNAQVIANMVSDIVFYPCETVMHRLHLQGTRTIIDNLDNGRTVLPILTDYTGPVDCYNMCIFQEGRAGLYKGFGALVLQYAAHIALIKLTRVAFTQIGIWVKDTKKEFELEAELDDTSPVISNVTSSTRSYLIP